MDEKKEQTIRTAIERHQEIVDALAARKGQRYCNKVTTFLGCTKMFTRLYQPTEFDHKGFCFVLMECMGVDTPELMHSFLSDVDIIRKAQELNL